MVMENSFCLNYLKRGSSCVKSSVHGNMLFILWGIEKSSVLLCSSFCSVHWTLIKCIHSNETSMAESLYRTIFLSVVSKVKMYPSFVTRVCGSIKCFLSFVLSSFWRKGLWACVSCFGSLWRNRNLNWFSYSVRFHQAERRISEQRAEIDVSTELYISTYW